MKKTFFLLLSGLVMGSGLVHADNSLLYSYDFESLSGSLNSANNNLTSTPGSGAFTQSGGGWVNYGPGALGSTLAYEAKTVNNQQGGKLTLTGTGTNNSLGVNTTDGFTLSFFFKEQGTEKWTDIFKLNFSDSKSIWSQQDTEDPGQAIKNCQFYTTDSNGLDNWAAFQATDSDFVHIALTYRDGVLTGYQDGVQFMYATGLDISGELTSVQFGTNSKVHAFYDNIQLYSGLLNQSEIAYLSTHEALPEPASASLGALGLALLSWRRKRKR